jgi:hypothetical protein
MGELVSEEELSESKLTIWLKEKLPPLRPT